MLLLFKSSVVVSFNFWTSSCRSLYLAGHSLYLAGRRPRGPRGPRGLRGPKGPAHVHTLPDEESLKDKTHVVSSPAGFSYQKGEDILGSYPLFALSLGLSLTGEKTKSLDSGLLKSGAEVVDKELSKKRQIVTNFYSKFNRRSTVKEERSLMEEEVFFLQTEIFSWRPFRNRREQRGRRANSVRKNANPLFLLPKDLFNPRVNSQKAPWSTYGLYCRRLGLVELSGYKFYKNFGSKDPKRAAAITIVQLSALHKFFYSQRNLWCSNLRSGLIVEENIAYFNTYPQYKAKEREEFISNYPSPERKLYLEASFISPRGTYSTTERKLRRSQFANIQPTFEENLDLQRSQVSFSATEETQKKIDFAFECLDDSSENIECSKEGASGPFQKDVYHNVLVQILIARLIRYRWEVLVRFKEANASRSFEEYRKTEFLSRSKFLCDLAVSPVQELTKVVGTNLREPVAIEISEIWEKVNDTSYTLYDYPFFHCPLHLFKHTADEKVFTHIQEAAIHFRETNFRHLYESKTGTKLSDTRYKDILLFFKNDVVYSWQVRTVNYEKIVRPISRSHPKSVKLSRLLGDKGTKHDFSSTRFATRNWVGSQSWVLIRDKFDLDPKVIAQIDWVFQDEVIWKTAKSTFPLWATESDIWTKETCETLFGPKDVPYWNRDWAGRARLLRGHGSTEGHVTKADTRKGKWKVLGAEKALENRKATLGQKDYNDLCTHFSWLNSDSSLRAKGLYTAIYLKQSKIVRNLLLSEYKQDSQKRSKERILSAYRVLVGKATNYLLFSTTPRRFNKLKTEDKRLFTHSLISWAKGLPSDVTFWKVASS